MTSDHWQQVWTERSPDEVSWFQPSADTSLALITEVSQPGVGVIDVGGGASTLIQGLILAGYRDLTVVDIAPAALEVAKERLGGQAQYVSWRVGDVTDLDPGRTFHVWHDRAVLHFLTDPDDRARYLASLERCLVPGGHAVIATFGPDGPEACSGLPVHRYDADALTETLGDGFELLDHRLEDHTTPAGATQQFLYAVARRRPAR